MFGVYWRKSPWPKQLVLKWSSQLSRPAMQLSSAQLSSAESGRQCGQIFHFSWLFHFLHIYSIFLSSVNHLVKCVQCASVEVSIFYSDKRNWPVQIFFCDPGVIESICHDKLTEKREQYDWMAEFFLKGACLKWSSTWWKSLTHPVHIYGLGKKIGTKSLKLRSAGLNVILELY